MTNPSFDADSFTPTQDLILDVLAARFRLGENLWTFGSRLRKAATQLADHGLVFITHGITEKTIRVGLTEAGKAVTLMPNYSPPPIQKHITESQLRDGLDRSDGWAHHASTAERRAYFEGMRDTLRFALGDTATTPAALAFTGGKITS